MSIENKNPSRKELREAVDKLRRVSNHFSNHDGHWGIDRVDASDYFKETPKWREDVIEYIASIKSRGEDTVFFDICGSANARSLGCDVNYHFTAQDTHKGHHLDTERFVGDIFSPVDFNKAISDIKNSGHRLALSAFNPVAGLQDFTPHKEDLYRDVIYQRLFSHLEKLVSLTHHGGYILVTMPFQLDNARIDDMLHHLLGHDASNSGEALSDAQTWVAQKADLLNCSIRHHKSKMGSMWLLRKSE